MRPYILLCALVLASIFLFAKRAVYTDEPQYLHVAKSAIERDWLFPQDTPWIFFGKRFENLSAQTHPPVGEYYLAMLLKMVGHFEEFPFRMLFAIFPLLAIVSFYRLARHFTRNPLVVSCLFAVSPVFFILSPTLMMDIPMLALLLAGVSLYLDGFERRWLLWPSSFCFLLAVGISYTALVPIGCLLLWAFATKRPIRESLAIAMAPAAACAWLLLLKTHFGQSPAGYLIDYYTSHFSPDQTILPLFSFIGGVTIFPWMHLVLVETTGRLKLAILSILGGFFLTLFSVWPSIPYRLWCVFLASSGIGFLLLFVRNATRPIGQEKRPKGYGFLLIWIAVALAFLLIFAEMISARYMLMIMPPLFLVAFERIHRNAVAYIIASTLILSVMLAAADYRFVNSYRDWVSKTIRPLQQQGFTIWNAAESGLRFYLEQEGLETLENSDLRPRGGDLIVRQSSFRYGLARDLDPLLINIRRIELRDPYPIRTFSREGRAGFHDSHFGQVPFIISRAMLDRIEIEEVSPFLLELPQVVPEDYSSVPVWSPDGVLLKQVDDEMKFPIRIPRNSKMEYELEGNASVMLSDEGIVLRKESPGPVVWKNFRITPQSWPEAKR